MVGSEHEFVFQFEIWVRRISCGDSKEEIQGLGAGFGDFGISGHSYWG